MACWIIALRRPMTCTADRELLYQPERIEKTTRVRTSKQASTLHQGLSAGRIGATAQNTAETYLLVGQPVCCADEFDTVVEETRELQQRQLASALRPQHQNIGAFVVRRFSNLHSNQAAKKIGSRENHASPSQARSSCPSSPPLQLSLHWHCCCSPRRSAILHPPLDWPPVPTRAPLTPRTPACARACTAEESPLGQHTCQCLSDYKASTRQKHVLRTVGSSSA